MIILLYGENSYRSREKLNQIIEKYKDSDKTQSGLFLFDEDFGLEKFHQAVTEQSFFSLKKLIVFKDIFSSKSQKDFKHNLESYLKAHQELFASKDIVIVFWEHASIKANDALFKYLTKKDSPVKKQEFKGMSEAEIKKWIHGQLPKSTKITQEAAQNLILYTNGDLWKIHNELHKIMSCKREGEITKEDVDFLVTGDTQITIFQVLDMVGQKRLKDALKGFKMLAEKGEDKIYLFSMMVYQFRNLIKMKSAAQGNVSFGALAKELKMHPFVVQKTLAQARNFSLDFLKTTYRDLLDFDVKIKTGKIDPELAIDLVLYSLEQR